MEWVAATAGERLYGFIGNQFKGAEKRYRLNVWKDLQTLMMITNRGVEFASFVEQIVRLHVQYRAINLLKGLKLEAEALNTEVTHHDRIIRFEAELPICADQESLEEFIQLSTEAETKVRQFSGKVPARLRDLVMPHPAGHCYICNMAIDRDAVEKSPNRAEMDHLWPRSFGGDTTVENLMPACGACNRMKDNLPTWAWALVQSEFISPKKKAKEHNEKLMKVNGRTKVAVYLRHVIDRASYSQITLKEAARKIGPNMPLQSTKGHVGTSDFFDLFGLTDIENSDGKNILL